MMKGRGKGAARKNKLFLWVLVVMAIVSMEGIWPGNGGAAYAAGTGDVSIRNVGQTSAIQGDTNVPFDIEVQNDTDHPVSFDRATLRLEPAAGINVSGGMDATINLDVGDRATIHFSLDIARSADTGTRTGNFIIQSAGNTLLNDSKTIRFRVYEKDIPPKGEDDDHYVAALDFTNTISPIDGFQTGNDNEIRFKIRNKGNTYVENAQMTLGLPEGLSIYNDSSTQFIGTISTTGKREATFQITVDKDTAGKNYPINVELTGVDRTGKDVSVKKTFYVPVIDTSTYSMSGVTINNVDAPKRIPTGEDFTMFFDVCNYGDVTVDDLVVSVDPPEGIVNKSKNVFIEDQLKKGERKNFFVTMTSDSAALEKSYPIKITVKSAKSKNEADVAMQYANVELVKLEGNTKTPQLMVDQYQYGGTYVQAGSKFRLNLGLFNTNAKDVTNVKVTLNSEDGTFIPVNGGSAFFFDTIEKKGHASHAMLFTVKPSAEQKTYAMDVDMTYEDGKGNEFTAKETISIPVMQRTLLQVDDIVPPAELYAGVPASLSLQFYNKGKTILNNLTVSASGDFDVTESIHYFAGNMEPGKSDTYDFTFTPRKEGPLEGQVEFKYEDASGEERVYAVPFTFQVMGEMPAMNEEPTDTQQGNKGIKAYLPWIAVGAAAVVLIAFLAIRKVRKKRKLNQELEIDE